MSSPHSALLSSFGFSAKWFAVTLVCCSLTSHCLAREWPQPNHLALFVPLDAANGINDTSGNVNIIAVAPRYPKLVVDRNGPFDVKATSHTVQCSTCPGIAYYALTFTPVEFTFSFYHFHPAVSPTPTATTAIWSVNIGSYAFTVNYVSSNTIEIRLMMSSGINYLIWSGPVLKPDQWNFFALTYRTLNNNQAETQAYDANGNLVGTASILPPIPPVSMITLTLGVSLDTAARTAYMKSEDALACFMLYRKALSGSEIAQLPGACGNDDRVESTITLEATLTTAQFVYNGSLIGWSDELFDENSAMFAEATRLYQEQLEIIYTTAKLDYQSITINGFMPSSPNATTAVNRASSVIGIVVEYRGVIRSLVPPLAVDQGQVVVDIDNALEAAIYSLEVAGAFLDIFGPIIPFSNIISIAISITTGFLDSGSPLGVIIGIAIGSVVLIAVIGCIIWGVVRRKKSK